MIEAALSERITAYLSGGGLFNPELANHDAVRDLLIECRAVLSQQAAPPAPEAPASTPNSMYGETRPSIKVVKWPDLEPSA
jgi:hypothetical protein